MDLQSVERKVKAGTYETPEDFEYDMSLVFRNCETYNAQRKGDHLVSMAKFGAKQFRRLFALRMRTFEDPASVTTKEEQNELDAASPANKKIKVEGGGAATTGKVVPRISITAARITSAQEKAAQTAKTQQKNRSQPVAKNQPVPLHIAIARVKEAYPLRRAHKSLQTWEADCARFFKDLMRHPWISAARPKVREIFFLLLPPIIILSTYLTDHSFLSFMLYHFLSLTKVYLPRSCVNFVSGKHNNLRNISRSSLFTLTAWKQISLLFPLSLLHRS